MPTTSSHLLPYPDASDPADVPADIAALAEAVDTKLDAIAPSQITGPTSGQLLIANSSGVVTGTAVSGDVVISNTGDAQIQASAVGTNELDDDAVTTAKIDDSAVTSAKIADGTITNADVSTSAAIAESKLSLASDAAAGTASRRTLGTGATQACAGNDSRLSNSRTPTGSAGGDLTGTYPNPTIGTGKVTSAKIADGTIVNGDIANSTIAPGKLSPVVGEAHLTANLGLSLNAWNTVLTVNTGQAGTYVMMASGTFGGPNSNNILVSINTAQGGGTYSTWGMLVNGNPYGSFSQQGVGYSSNGVINLAIYSYAAKQEIGSGTRLSVFRIG